MAEILSVVWYRVHPDRFGGQKGIAQFNRFLSAHHRLTCLCSRDNEPDKAGYPLLARLPTGKWQFLNPVNIIRIWKACRQVGATHLIIEHPPYGPAGWLVCRMLGIRLVLHAHNIESDILRQTHAAYWRLAAVWERLALRSADLVLFKTPEDRAQAVDWFRLDPGRTHIVPFGVLRTTNPGSQERSKARRRLEDRFGIGPDERILYFGGTLDFGPNAEVVGWLHDELLPEIRIRSKQPFRLVITGRRIKGAFQWLDGYHDASCIYAGEIEDTTDLMLGADLLVNPVVSGSGIKVKNMEAIASGLTVVTTPHGARGIDGAVAGPKLVICQVGNTAAFADTVIRHWRDGVDTPAAFYERYHWSHIVSHTADRITSC
jgi:hypothetical protein